MATVERYAIPGFPRYSLVGEGNDWAVHGPGGRGGVPGPLRPVPGRRDGRPMFCENPRHPDGAWHRAAPLPFGPLATIRWHLNRRRWGCGCPKTGPGKGEER